MIWMLMNHFYRPAMMKIFSLRSLILLLLLQSAWLHAADLQPRIIGGNDTDADEWPATVALLFTDIYDSSVAAGDSVGVAQFNAQFCAGTLLTPKWVLTAAHCVHDTNNQPFPAADILVLAGVTDLLVNGQQQVVTNIIVNPSYDPLLFDSDIALLELANETVAPATDIPLYQGDPAVGSDATVVGWGDTTNSLGVFPDILQEAVVQVISTTDCNSATAYNDAITDNMLCAAATGKDSCGGDSGGPLMAMQNGGFRQVGIVSFGNECALPNFPGVYTRVDRFSTWINDIINLPPIADPQDITTDEETAVSITLSGTDPDGVSLSYTVVTQPANGVLTGTAPALTYTPNTDINGNDSFTFLVNDGVHDSAPVTVSIVVNGVNDAPTANSQSTSTNENTAASINLTGSDPDGDSLAYTVVSQPANGVLSGTAPALTYMPNAGYNGSDSFTFMVNDGNLESTPATVSITVNGVNSGGNNAPAANPQSITTEEDTAAVISLTGSDPDGDSLTYTVVNEPANGELSGTAPALTYTPYAGYNGSDSFTFMVNDGNLDSNTPATVSITVRDAGAASGGGGGGSLGWILLPMLLLAYLRISLSTSWILERSSACKKNLSRQSAEYLKIALQSTSPFATRSSLR